MVKRINALLVEDNLAEDALGHIKDFNLVAERLTGWTAQEAKRRSITDICNIIDGETGERLTNPVIKAIAEGPVMRQARKRSLSHSSPFLFFSILKI